MTLRAFRFACAFLVSAVAALPCEAESFASFASSAGSASLDSISASLNTSSGSSKHKFDEGDYRIVEVMGAERPERLRLKMQPVAHPDDEAAAIYLDLPRAALADRVAAAGDIIGVRQRPYGYEFSWGDTRVAFFLALADDWRRELDTRPL
jgi:hypothetical protein